MIKAAIFDMDGLLIDSEPFWRKSHVDALAEHDVHITEDDVRKMAGKRTDEVVRHWRETHGLVHVSNDTLENAVVRRVTRHIHESGEGLPGVEQVINLLTKQNIPLAVASSSSPEIIDTVLEKLDLKKHLQFAHSAKHESFGKPHPAVFLTTAKKLGVDPADCVVFEDSLSGVRAAKAAGMKCIAVPEQANLHKEEFHTEADLVVKSLDYLDWPTLQRLFATPSPTR
jgi:mannitol-1-/sugar-/sorbitol-6-/2-deoxyglucose-6-phosphatase